MQHNLKTPDLRREGKALGGQSSKTLQQSDNASDKTNLTAIMRSHMIDEAHEQRLLSDERRLQQIMEIQNLNRNRLEQIKGSHQEQQHV